MAILVWICMGLAFLSLVNAKKQGRSTSTKIFIPEITYIEGEDEYDVKNNFIGNHFEDISELENDNKNIFDTLNGKNNKYGDAFHRIHEGLENIHTFLIQNTSHTFPKRLKFDLADPENGQIYTVDLRKNYNLFDTKTIQNSINQHDKLEYLSINQSNKTLLQIPDCYYQGYVRLKSPAESSKTSFEDTVGYIAVCLCNGIEGVMHTDTGGDYSIKPRKSIRTSSSSVSFAPHASLDFRLGREHVLKSLNSVGDHSKHSTATHNCGVDIDIVDGSALLQNLKLDAFQMDIENSGGDEVKPSIFAGAAKENMDFGAQKVYTIKVSIFLDSFLYNQLLRKGLKTDDDILLYVLTIFNGVQLLYNHNSMGIKLQLILSHFEIMKNAKPEIMHERVTHLLEAFGTFQRKLNKPRKWDVAILMTGLDVYAIAKRLGASNKVTLARAILGYAYVGSMCDSKYSVTISEGKGYKPVFTIAHELGHTLGLEHDGKDNDCEDWKYIMASRLAPGIATWSSCSRKRMQKFIKHFECLKDNVEADDIVVEDPLVDILPGQRANADRQCEAAYGPGSRWLSDPRYPLETVCKLIRCTPAHGTYIVVELLIHPAMEGTYCGPQKWCRSGSCVQYPPDAIINGGWTQWFTAGCILSPVAPCISGIKGIRKWERDCTNPSPENGGIPCIGSDTIYETCQKSTEFRTVFDAAKNCGTQPASVEDYIAGSCLAINATADIPLNGLFFQDPKSQSYLNEVDPYFNHVDGIIKSVVEQQASSELRGNVYNKQSSAHHTPFVLVAPKEQGKYGQNSFKKARGDYIKSFQNPDLSQHYYYNVEDKPLVKNDELDDIFPTFSNVYPAGNYLSPCKFHCFAAEAEKIMNLNLPNGITCNMASKDGKSIAGICIEGECKSLEKRDGSWGPFLLESDCENRECLEKSVNLKYYKRRCNNPPALNGGKQCKGGDTLYQICRDRLVCLNKKKTPEEYATNICGLLSKLPEYKFLTGQGLRYPHNNHRLRCAIWCKTDRGGMISPSGLYFPDGANCHRQNDPSSHMYCLRRTCVEFKKNGKPSP